MSTPAPVRVSRLVGDCPLRGAVASGPEASIHEAGVALRARAAGALAELLVDLDIADCIDRRGIGSMGHGPLGPVAEIDQLAAQVDDLLDHHDVRSQFELMSEGRLVAAEGLFTGRSIGSAGAQLRRGALAGAVARSGLTIRVTAVDQQLPALAPISWAFDAAFGTRSTANLYVTGGDTPGTAAHFDHHDVVLLQLVGEKSWQVSAPESTPVAGRSGEAPMTHVDWAGTVRAGEFLSLPRGWAHRVVPSGELSVHLTIALRRPSYADVFGDLWSFLGATGGWTADLPGGDVDHERITAELSSMLGGLGSADLAGTTDHLLSSYRAMLPPRPLAPFSRVEAATRAPLEWSYRWAVPAEPVVVDRPSGGFAVAGWLLEVDDCCRDAFVGMVAADRWTPDPGAGTALAAVVAALIELDILDPLAQDDGR